MGDRNIVEAMKKKDFILGGEPSGHIILSNQSATGDGILASLEVLGIMKFQNKKLNHSDFDWITEKMKKYDVLNDCLQKARHFSIMAKDSLGTFIDNKEKQKLMNLANFLINRKS